MNPTEDLNDDEREFERALAGLTPGGAPSREDVLFEAGVRSARRHVHAWQGLSAALTVALAAALVAPAVLRGPAATPPGVVMQNVATPAPVVATVEPTAAPVVEPESPTLVGVSPALNPASYFHARDVALTQGLDALSRLQPAPAPAQPVKRSFTSRIAIDVDQLQ